MKNSALCLSFCLLLGTVRAADLTPETRYELAKRELDNATTDDDRLRAVVKLRRLSEELGRFEDQRQYGKELVRLVEQRSRWQPQEDLAKARHAVAEADTDLKRFLALRSLAEICFHQKDLGEWRQHAQEMIELGLKFEGERRVGVLPSIAKVCLELGRLDEAARHAKECLELAPKFQETGSFGACVHRGNWVLGRVALQAGRTADAKRHLLASAEVEGTVWAKYFPPNMSLAKELLANNEREAVLQYLERCTEVWRTRPDHEGNFKAWIATIKAGKIPDFGANLRF